MARTIDVDRKRFEAAVKHVEDKEQFFSINKMLQAAVAHYNNGLPEAKHMTVAVGNLRLQDWSIKIKTVSMRGVEVDKKLLADCVKAVEANGSVDGGVVQMHKLVADEYNRRSKVPITFSVVGLRIKEFDIPFITTSQKGKGLKGRKLSDEQKAAMRAGRTGGTRKEKYANDPAMQEAFRQQRADCPERFLPLLEAAQAGSNSATLKIHCLQCANYQTVEVRHCQVLQCMAWHKRPYQGKQAEPEEEGQTAIPDDNEPSEEAA